MKNSITIEEANILLDKYLKTKSLRFHSRESEVILRKLAVYFTEDEDFWGITGLLHDLDMDVINGDNESHGYKTVEILKEEGYEIPVMFEAILAHTEGFTNSKETRKTKLDYVLSGAENLAGLISAYVAVRPGKKIDGAKVKSLTKKLKDRSFAAAVSREIINDVAEKTEIERSEFFKLGIEAMSEISVELEM